MGLGLNGGGLASAVFLAKRGAELIVTDLRGEDVLRPSIEALEAAVRETGAPPPRYVLGRHELSDFEAADIVIKNPGVRPDSPYLKAAKRVETDISLFLRENPARICAVTGSKGKSFTASALYSGLSAYHKECTAKNGENCGAAFLGGNITVSPLTFIEKLDEKDDVVLELSSWQLGDLPQDLLKPHVALFTSIMSDHLDRYGTMEAYVADKKLIYKNQDSSCLTIARDEPWGEQFLRETKARTAFYGEVERKGTCGWFDSKKNECFARGPLGVLGASSVERVVLSETAVPGRHQKLNLLGAALAMLELGLKSDFIANAVSCFKGIEHRLEFFYENAGIKFYNDSAATIPEAAAAAIAALKKPVLITGGTDKSLDFAPLLQAAAGAKKIILLEGTASDKLCVLFRAAALEFEGPFGSLEAALHAALEAAQSGDSVVLSPGCTSFGMFLNEFDRGKKWKAAVLNAFS
ncbi:MAG: UDP-N-acetylmuramoyl-L-alanine--D-glutamate ligase [Spirochaetaceae bacterium]|jgi:UDP-N-acetylmuramoylalanine--D-glutamate ligase|nr:UDP-N-acetylmuramoyl-L-alanine--D-glutamate ligase [Spirochaetaceae bacterium]